MDKYRGEWNLVVRRRCADGCGGDCGDMKVFIYALDCIPHNGERMITTRVRIEDQIEKRSPEPLGNHRLCPGSCSSPHFQANICPNAPQQYGGGLMVARDAWPDRYIARSDGAGTERINRRRE
jgi:hypothetical protein